MFRIVTLSIHLKKKNLKNFFHFIYFFFFKYGIVCVHCSQLCWYDYNATARLKLNRISKFYKIHGNWWLFISYAISLNRFCNAIPPLRFYSTHHTMQRNVSFFLLLLLFECERINKTLYSKRYKRQYIDEKQKKKKWNETKRFSCTYIYRGAI